MDTMQPPLPQTQFLKNLCENELFLSTEGKKKKKEKKIFLALLSMLTGPERVFAHSFKFLISLPVKIWPNALA